MRGLFTGNLPTRISSKFVELLSTNSLIPSAHPPTIKYEYHISLIEKLPLPILYIYKRNYRSGTTVAINTNTLLIINVLIENINTFESYKY